MSDRLRNSVCTKKKYPRLSSPPTKDAAHLINAYLAPTDGTAAGSPPTSIAHWTSALSTTQIIGWITADGRLAS